MKMDDTLVAYISLTIEEIVTNMNVFSNKSNLKPSMIDISIKRSDDKIIVRIRDNNINFDPTYSKDENDDIAGLTILSKLTSSVNYIRLLNLNNTIVEFSEGSYE